MGAFKTFFSFAFILSFGSQAQASSTIHSYEIKAQSGGMFALQELRNCVELEFCQGTAQQFDFKDSLYSINLKLTLSEEQMAGVFNRCPYYKWGTQVQFWEDGILKPIRPTAMNNDSYYPIRSAQYMNPADAAQLKKNIGSIEKMMSSKDYEGASQYVVETAHLDLMGFQIIFADNDLGFAVTDWKTKTITLSKKNLKSFTSGCELIRVLRHEVEHIHQNSFAFACQAKGMNSDFLDHNQRELSAYLNDSINVNAYCDNIDWVYTTYNGSLSAGKRYADAINKTPTP